MAPSVVLLQKLIRSCQARDGWLRPYPRNWERSIQCFWRASRIWLPGEKLGMVDFREKEEKGRIQKERRTVSVGSADVVLQWESSQGWEWPGEDWWSWSLLSCGRFLQRLQMEGITAGLATSAMLPWQSFPQVHFFRYILISCFSVPLPSVVFLSKVF